MESRVVVLHVSYPNPTGYQPTYAVTPPTNGTAIAALILVFVFFPLGVILGHVARGQIRRTGEGGSGLATAALIIGYLQVALMVVAVVVAAVLFVVAGAQ
jgi:uncharacterized membrane protein YidH (DUF202 family)